MPKGIRTINTADGGTVEVTHEPVVAIPSQADPIQKRRAELEAELRALVEEHGTDPENPDELRPFLVDLAPSSAYIDYNGIRYYHGETYKVDMDLWRSLAEIQGNTWKHEKTLHASENDYRRRINRRIR